LARCWPLPVPDSRSGGPSHFLSIFDKPGHCTLAASDAFADADKFFPEAMRLVAARFAVDLRQEKK
jgi:hypothetical protein